MSAKFNPPDQLEELSWLLDELNVNHQPLCDDKEMEELLAVATILKDTDIHILPPQHLLDQTVDRALAGIHAGKSKKINTWFFSGILGTVASILLVVGLNVLPSWQQEAPVAPQTFTTSQPQDNTPSESMIPSPPVVSQVTPSEQNPQTTVPAALKQALLSEGEQPHPPIPEAPIPPAKVLKSANVIKKSPPLEEKTRHLDQAKSAYIPAASFGVDSSSPSPLSLPNKTPDLIVADKKNASLRQVYNKDTPQEIIITQKLHPTLDSNVQSKLNTTVLMETAPDKSTPINTIKFMLWGQEVIIEGHQSKLELEKIAESLTQ